LLIGDFSNKGKHVEHRKSEMNDVKKCDESIKNESSLLEGINEFEEFLSSLYPR